MYRPDLDLLVVNDADEVVSYRLFWHDREPGVGFAEPMGTDDARRHEAWPVTY